MKREPFLKHIKTRIKTDVFSFVVILLYAALCLFSMIYSFSLMQIRNGLLCILFFSLSFLVYPIEYWLKIKIVPICLVLILFIAYGSVLGTCHEFYSMFPVFDLILHGTSGLVFACCGFTLMQLLIGKPTTTKKFFACMLFGFMFTLALAVLWELFEFSVYSIMGFDMMEDSIIDGFASYLLAGNHSEIVNVDGITQTIIYYGNEQSIVIEGYLDIGLLDTITDMFICFAGSVVFMVVSIVSHFKCKKINDLLCPQLIYYSEDGCGAEPENAHNQPTKNSNKKTKTKTKVSKEEDNGKTDSANWVWWKTKIN